MMKKLMIAGMALMLLSAGPMAYAEDVFVTKNGSKYHKTDCRFIKNRDTEAIDKEAAHEEGFQPCSRCFKQELSQVDSKASEIKTQ